MDQHQLRLLAERARAARAHAYAPYSGYSVGAALLTADGSIYDGCNIENAAFSATLCAERVALAKALSEGKREFAALAIAGGPAQAQAELPAAYPCGECRQWLAEFCRGDFPVIVARGADDYHCLTLDQLLPHHFGPAQLRAK